MQYCHAIPFFDKRNWYASMQIVCSIGVYLKIFSLLPEQIKGIFDLVYFTDLEQLPVLWRYIR